MGTLDNRVRLGVKDEADRKVYIDKFCDETQTKKAAYNSGSGKGLQLLPDDSVEAHPEWLAERLRRRETDDDPELDRMKPLGRRQDRYPKKEES